MIRHSISLLFIFSPPFQIHYQYQDSCLILKILNGNFNKNYRLPFERLYGGIKLRNHSYRKEELKKGVFASPTYLQFNIGHIIEDYRLEEWVTGEVSSVGSSPRPLVNCSAACLASQT
jgi:hypothetical protein